MHKLIKNLLFVFIIGFVSIGLPFGISKIISGDTQLGVIITILALAVIVMSITFAARYHKQNIHINGFGIVGGIATAVIGVYLVITLNLVSSVIFLKIGIIAVTLGLHTMATEKFGFWMQKVGISATLISLAFFHSVVALCAGIAVTFACFCISIFFNPFLREKKL